MIFNNSKVIKSALVVLLLSFSFLATGQGRSGIGGGSSCTVTVYCGTVGEVSCTSDTMDCEMDSQQGWVECDGITTYCN